MKSDLNLYTEKAGATVSSHGLIWEWWEKNYDLFAHQTCNDSSSFTQHLTPAPPKTLTHIYKKRNQNAIFFGWSDWLWRQ